DRGRHAGPAPPGGHHGGRPGGSHHSGADRPRGEELGRPGPALRRARPHHGGVHLPVPLAAERVLQAAGRGLRQQADPRDVHLRQLHLGVERGADGAVALQHPARHGAGDRDGDDLERDGGVGVQLLPVPRSHRALRGGPGHHDAAGCGDDDPGLPDLGRPRTGREPHPLVGRQPVRQRLLHLPAAAVLPRAAQGPLRGGQDRRGEQLADLLAGGAAVDEARADRDGAVRVPGGVDRPDAAADLPARLRHLHRPAGAQVAGRPVRVRRRVPLGDHRDRQRDHHHPDDHPVLPRSAALRPGHRHHRQQGL
ncbi:MAG: ABC transporter, permease protein 2 (cluster 1, maltose/g3p/polyamine/iron), partial [uncultured Nocardioidaceae bacterium]